MGSHRLAGIVILSLLFNGVMPSHLGAVELKFVGSKRQVLKSSLKAIGQGLESGDLATILRSSRVKESLLSFQRLFYRRGLERPLALRCRYGAAPKRKRALELNHAVEVRLDVPLDIHLRDAALTFSVDGSSEHREAANVLFSFSF